MNYKVSDERRKKFASLYMLNYMINTPKAIPVLLEGNDQDLEAILEFMMVKNLVEIKDQKYVPTEKGRDQLVRFMKRYQDYLKNFDVFCAVDLNEGEFAFQYIDEYDDDYDAWAEFLEEERWEDLRIAVAEYKKIDPVEIVFMSFINEGYYGKTDEGWQFDLLLGSIWDEITEVCETSLHVDDLGWEDDDGEVTGEEVMKDILAQGADLNNKIREEAEKIDEAVGVERFADDDPDSKRYVEEVEIEPVRVEIYESYYSPGYVNPIWLAPLFLF
ncbi:MAG: hypothetical protein JXR48_08015 [Candidatus Delongbacteria bacterium]|nr:hypothetical protein [Candidatus Delongbacteria bacterium]MBN2834898.1 hypothetical protein [Candidatus Delongbacteria bacterium]